MASEEGQVTVLLKAMSSGDATAEQSLFPLVYHELHRLAQSYMRRERAGHTLQPTALVNKLFLKLMGGATVEWKNRAHFLAVASQQLRRILVDHARQRQSEKRGGGLQATTLVEASAVARTFEENLLDLHDALDGLAGLDPRAARVIKLRFFGGLGRAHR